MSESPWRVAAPGSELELRVVAAVLSRAIRVPSRNMKSARENTSGGEWEPVSGEASEERRSSGESTFMRIRSVGTDRLFADISGNYSLQRVS